MGLNTHVRNCFILSGPDIDGLCKPKVQIFPFPLFSIPFVLFFSSFSFFFYFFLLRITHCKNWLPAYHLKVKKTS